MNIFVLDRNYNKIGILSNEGVNPKAPYFDDLYTQELDTGADVFYFSTLATYYAQDIIEIGNHVVFEFNNQQKMFVISSLEFEHKDGMNVIGVYSEGAGFELLEKYKKDISIEGDYKKFLGEILADTDWKYTVSDSLSGLSQKVEYTEEKNIYAILQDSIQTYQGVELEFITDYRDGAPTKTIRAYGNGERGSFVGKRFEYGVNVKGIVKTQNVSNTKDENVIFNEGLVVIDGLQVEISYDVDFALRSEEVPELNIGDAHYIIDNDFNPPLQIRGRIGKIEISFSDPTRNKVYLANFKKITGSKSDDTNEDDVKDIVDDVLSDPDSHMHCSLISRDYDPDYLMTFGYLPNVIGSGSGCTAALFFKDFELTYTMTSRYDQVHWLSVTVARYDDFVGEYTDDYTVDRYYAAELYNSSGHLIPSFRGKQDIGSSEKHWRNLYVDNIYTKNGTNIGGGTQIKSYIYALPFDREQMEDIDQINDSSDITKQDLLEYMINEVDIYKYMYSAEKEDNENSGITYSGQYLGILSDSFFNHDAEADEIDGCATLHKVTPYIMRNVSNGEGGHRYHEYNLPALVVALIGAFQQYVANGGNTGNDGNNGNDGNDGSSGSDGNDGFDGTLPDAFEIIDGKLHIKLPVNFENSASFINCGVTGGLADLTGIQNLGVDVISCNRIDPGSDEVLTVYGDLEVTGNIISSSGGGSVGDTITVKKIIGGNPAYGEAPQYVEIEDALCVKKIFGGTDGGSVEWEGDLDVAGNASIYQNATVSGNLTYYGTLSQGSDKSLKENIRYIDDSIMTTSDDLLEKADLHNFIVNQVNLCEYNFIGNDSDKIGFIANDYEGTKVGDKIVSRHDDTLTYDVNNLLFATIGALQEEVRIKDEKIASLEARLAKIEEMLGINNN